MELFVGLLVLGVGVALVTTGALGRVPQLLATVTGKGTGPDPTANAQPAGYTAPAAPAGPSTGPVRYA